MSDSVQAVERAIDILLIIAAERTGAGISEIAVNVGLAKSAVHRILVALAKKRMVEQDPVTQRYILGPKVLELGAHLFDQTDIIGLAQPHLERLSEMFRETASLALRTDVTYIYVSTRPPRREHRITPIIGKPLPLHWTGFGKAILASLPPTALDDYLTQGELARATARTIVDPHRLQEEMWWIRQRGYALSIGERVEGAFALATAILDTHGHPIGAMGLSGPASRLPALDEEAMGQAVMEAAYSLSMALRSHTQAYNIPMLELAVLGR